MTPGVASTREGPGSAVPTRGYIHAVERSAGVADQPHELPGEGELIRDAYAAAQRIHRGQKRKADGAEFIGHLARVAALVKEAGADDEAVAAALLHDAVEKTDVAGEEIAEQFGDRVRTIVLALSDDPAIEDYAERKRALRRQAEAADETVAMIYAADKLVNLRDIRAVWEEQPEVLQERLGISVEGRVELFREDVEMVRGKLEGLGLVDVFDSEVTAFERALAEA